MNTNGISMSGSASFGSEIYETIPATTIAMNVISAVRVRPTTASMAAFNGGSQRPRSSLQPGKRPRLAAPGPRSLGLLQSP